MEWVKAKHNLLLLEYEPGRRLLKVIQKRTSRLATMGIIRKGCHFFFPEEGVWLMEAGQAAILLSGYPFSIQQGFHLLASSQVSFAKYLVYSYLKRAGYIVLPSNRATEMANSDTQGCSLKAGEKDESYLMQKFPQHLLDQFPSISSTNFNIANLHRQESFADKFGISPNFPEIDASMYSPTPRFPEKLRSSRSPRFDQSCKSAQNWKAYREALREHCSRKRRTGPEGNIHSYLLQPDYDIYASNGTYSHNRTPPPLFQLFVCENCHFGLPSQSELHQLSSRVCVAKLLIGVVHNSVVLFYDANHQSIQL